MRFFNVAGPVRPDDHCAIPPLDRVEVDGLLGLIRAKQYFVLHAPQQTAKTSALIALRGRIRSSTSEVIAGTVERGVEQTLGYMAKCGAEEGHLVVIDRRAGAENRRDGEGGGDGSERRQDGRGVMVWTL